MAAAATAPPFSTDRVTLFIKGGPNGVVGDCPFSAKANLALRFRKVDFDVHLIDLANKPDWFLAINDAGTTPTFVHATHTIGDSEEIIEHADTIGDADVALNREEDPNWEAAFDAVSPIFGSMARFLKNKDDAEQPSVKQALDDALVALNSFLTSVPGPFLLGDQVSALDCNLAPKLKHAFVAPTHFKGYEIPSECAAVKEYLAHFETLEEWKASAFTDDVIVWGWGKHLN